MLPTEQKNTNLKTQIPIPLPVLLKGIYTNDPHIQSVSVDGLCQLTVQYKQSRKTLIELKTISRLIEIASAEANVGSSNITQQTQYEALCTLSNIASSQEYITQMIDHKVHELFIDLLKWPSYAIKEEAMWALARMSGNSNSEKLNNLLLTNNILFNILSICESQFNKKHIGVIIPYNTTFSKNKINDDPSMLFLELISMTALVLKNLSCKTLSTLAHIELIIKCLKYLLKHALEYEKTMTNIRKEIKHIFHLISDTFCNLMECFQYQVPILNVIQSEGILKECIDLIDHGNDDISSAGIAIMDYIFGNAYENIVKCNYLDSAGVVFNKLCDASALEIPANIYMNGCIIEAAYRCIRNILSLDNRLIVDRKLYRVLTEALLYQSYNIGKNALLIIFQANLNTDAEYDHYGVMNGLCFFLNTHKPQENDLIWISIALRLTDKILNIGQQNIWNLYALEFKKAHGLKYLYYLKDSAFVTTDVLQICNVIIQKYFETEPQIAITGEIYYQKQQYQIAIRIFKKLLSFQIYSQVSEDKWIKLRGIMMKEWDKMACTNCGKVKDLKSCKGCIKAAYCSRKCQKYHWNYTHRFVCNKQVWKVNSLLKLF